MKFKLLFLLVASISQIAMSQYTLQLPERDVKVSDRNGVAVFSGASLSGQPGEPQLPHYVVSFLLPPSADFNNVKASIENLKTSTLEQSYYVEPTPPVAVSQNKVFWPAGRKIVDGKDVEIYSSKEYFPSSHIGKISFGKMRQYKVVDIEIIPYRYNPVTRNLLVLTGGILTLSVSGVQSQSSAKSLTNKVTATNFAEKELKRKVVNFEVKSEYEQSRTAAPSGASSCFAIITTEDIVNNSTQLNNFIASKQGKGFTVEVITESRWGGGTGDIAAERLRTWLKNNYLSLNITNLLLIGNPDPSTGSVPMKMCFPRQDNEAYPEAPTDFYYAELTGNWDADHDGRYGEYEDYLITGGPDKMAEVIIARIPYYGSIQKVDKILAKTIAYDNEVNKSWRRNTLLPMEPCDVNTSGIALAQQIKKDVLIPNSINFYRLADSTYGETVFTDVTSLCPPAEMIPCNYDNVQNAWSNNPYGLVVWMTHGWSTGASDIFTSDMTMSLNDSRPSFTFQVSCTNGQPEEPQNLGYALLENGAIGTISATRVSWYWIGQTEFANTPTNSGMSYAYSQYLIAEKLSAGEALIRIKSNLNVDNNVWWMNLLVFNLYGSPDMTLDLPDPVYISDLPIVSSQNGWGPIEIDKSNGGSVAGDGAQLGLGDMVFAKGLGTHAYSEAVYNLNGVYSKFSSWIGIDREEGTNGTVDYQVFADGSNIYNSGLQSGQMSPRRVSLNVSSVNQLRLVVNDYDGNQNYDHADWADAHLLSEVSDNLIQAEDTRYCTWINGSTVDNNNNGFTGTGFINTPGANGAWVQCQITVAKAGLYNFDIRFANGSSARNAIVNVNGTDFATGNFAATGAWTNWNNETFSNISFNAGVNTIRITATTSGGLANIDRYDFTRLSPDTYSLTTNCSGPGTVSRNPDKTEYDENEYITLTANATPGAGFKFSEWSGDLSGNTNPISFTINKNMTVTAKFVPYELNVYIEGCGNIYIDDVNGRKKVTASPCNNYLFSHWSGDTSSMINPVYITLDRDKHITAHFTQIKSDFTIEAENTYHFSWSSGTTIDNNHSGYTGNGFVNAPNAMDSWIQCDFNQDEDEILYDIKIRYANGGVESRNAKLNVNGIDIATKSFASTGAWNNWSEEVFSNVSLERDAKYAAKFRLIATSSGGLANIDKIVFEKKKRFIQAENMACCEYDDGAKIENEHSGFTGTGYIDSPNKKNSRIRCRVTVTEGSYKFNVRFANGSSKARGAIISVNGITDTGTFSSTGAWTSWNNETFSNIRLNEGENTIFLDALTSDGLANIDRFDLTRNITIQAEDNNYCSWSSGTTVDNNNAGFTGTGFVNTPNAANVWTQFQISVETAGTYNIYVRYANGSSARGATLSVNGTNVGTCSFTGNGAWTNWSDEILSNISLNAGLNTIRLTASTSDGLANIDCYDINK